MSLMFAAIRSCSFALLQGNASALAANGEQARLPAKDNFCGQIVVN
jgi:hypothetical protein